MSAVRSVVHILTQSPRRLFLIDSLGALLTGCLLLILSGFEPVLGMPAEVLYVLASIAFVFALYSFLCFRFFPEKWPFFLKGIALANLGYCCLTMGLIFYFFDELTVWGLVYFLAEIGIVTMLAGVELSVRPGE